MGSLRARIQLLLLALALTAGGGTAAHAAGLGVLVLKTENRTDAKRTAASVDSIVVHVAEGGFWGSVRWLRNPRSHGSSHYIVSRRGEVVQLVSTSDVAWHAGNLRFNRRSIGIEHEGWTYRGGFTDAQYRTSAQLVAHLSRRLGIPLDRRHVIGHDEVPDPDGSGFGGASHHTDPGPHWEWRRYMSLVRHYTQNPVRPQYVKTLPSLPPAPPLPPLRAAVAKKPASTAVLPGARVQGVAHWWSGIDAAKRWRRGIDRVDFFVDGRLLWTDRVWPFAYRGGAGWDTNTVANGRHMLAIRVHGRKGYRARRAIPVRVVNPPVTVAVQGVSAGEAVRGDLPLTVRVGERVEGVSLYVDDVLISRDDAPPYQLSWNSESASEGEHEVAVYARARSGRRGELKLPIVVANAMDVPPSLWGPTLDHMVDGLVATPPPQP